jgi:hypothetical protein
MLMMMPMRWASHSRVLAWLAKQLSGHSVFWFPK